MRDREKEGKREGGGVDLVLKSQKIKHECVNCRRRCKLSLLIPFNTGHFFSHLHFFFSLLLIFLTYGEA